ncbi:DUF4158 domain-containing protein [Streptosporangium sp. KLBMP 9127]|nr:DUF4158 domain-containing protein [Streptosporangium sp. KLBMP 9127]
MILKFYEIEGRFPAYAEEVPQAAVEYIASLVKVDTALFTKYSWQGRTIEYHRAQIRKARGTRPASEADEERWAQWLADKVCLLETDRGRLADAVRQRCRSESVEPPTEGQLERVVASAVRRFEEAFADGVVGRLGPVACDRLEDLLGKPRLLAELKSDPGPLGLDTLLVEIGKLNTARSLGLGEEVFAETSDRLVAAWRARASRMFPSDYAECAPPVRYTLLAALCWTRQAELVDGLVELLIGLIQRINARAERRVEKELIGELAHVPGKRGILGRMVNAALERPEGTVRQVVYPAVGQPEVSWSGRRGAGLSPVLCSAQLVAVPGEGLFGRGDGAEQLLLAAGVGDVAAGVEPAEHRGHVLDQGHEAAGDGSRGAGDGGRDGPHLDLLSGPAAHQVGYLAHADRAVPADVDALTVVGLGVDCGCQVRREIGGVDEGQRDGGLADPQHAALVDRVARHARDLVEERPRAQCEERDAELFEFVLGELLVPEVWDIGRLVAGEDAGQDEPSDAGAMGGLGEVGVADGVDVMRVLAAAGVAGGGGDDGIGAVHGGDERVKVEHVAAGDLHALAFEPARVADRPHQGADVLATLE